MKRFEKILQIDHISRVARSFAKVIDSEVFITNNNGSTALHTSWDLVNILHRHMNTSTTRLQQKLVSNDKLTAVKNSYYAAKTTAELQARLDTQQLLLTSRLPQWQKNYTLEFTLEVSNTLARLYVLCAEKFKLIVWNMC